MLPPSLRGAVGLVVALLLAAGAQAQTPFGNDFETLDGIGSWKNTSSDPGFTLSISADAAEGSGALQLDYDFAADLSWGGSVDFNYDPEAGFFDDMSAAEGIRFRYKTATPISNTTGVSFAVKLVDQSTGPDENFEVRVPDVITNATGEWQEVEIPFSSFAVPSWAEQGDSSFDLDKIDQWQMQVIGAAGESYAGSILIDDLSLYGVPAPTSDLVITGVLDGPRTGGTPKAVELYALNDIADLSAYGLAVASNGGGSDGAPEIALPAEAVSAGTFIYVASEAVEFEAFFGFAPDTTGSVFINGDDAIELYLSGAVVDVFGDVDTDGTGQPWEYLDGWAYRKSGTTAGGSTFTVADWTYSGIDALDGATTNATATTPFPLGTYSTTPPAGPATLTALLRGENEVPAVETDAKGGVTAVVDGTSLTVSGTFAGLSGTFAAAHLHGGAAGETGDPVVTLTATTTDDMMGGSFEAASNTFTIRETFADSIRAGLVYVNVHSSTVASGEIRGQLGTDAHVLPFGLDGAQEVPPVTTDATGSGTVTVDGAVVTVSGAFEGLGSDYVASHIHAGPAGEPGGVVVTLAATVDGGARGGTWEAANNTFTVRPTFADSLRAGLAYVNVHTTDNATGEIRGQIGTPAPEPPPFGVVNGSFEDSDTGVVDPDVDTAGWNFTLGGSPLAAATFEVVEGGAYEGDKSLKVSVTAVGQQAYHIEAANEPIYLEADVTYTYSIWAKSESDGATAAFTLGAPPPTYTEYGAIRDNVSLTTEWQQFTFEFTPAMSEVRAPVHFSFAANVGNAVYIDALTIEKAPSSIAEARAAGVGETVTVEGTVTRAMGAFTYFQDATGGLTIRQTSGDFFDAVAGGSIAPGTMLRVTGELSEFASLLQINGGDLASFEILGTGDVPEPQTVTLAELASNGEDYEGELVTVRAVTFAETGTFEAATTYDVSDDSDATNAVSARVPNADDSTVDGTAIPPVANLTAIVGQFDFDDPTVGYQLLLIDAADVVNSVSTEGGAEAALSLTVANPVHQAATVRFTLDAPGEASVSLYDALGRRVATLADGDMGLGVQTARLDAAGLASGVYVLRLEAESGFVSQTITVVR